MHTQAQADCAAMSKHALSKILPAMFCGCSGTTLRPLIRERQRGPRWKLARGTAGATHINKVFLLGEYQCNHTLIGDVYRLRNPGKLNLETIEGYSGSCIVEEATAGLEVSWGCSKLVKEA